MNRNEEYDTLLRELERTPPELEHTVSRAKTRVTRRRRSWLALPAAAAALFAAFVVMVNASPSFAERMEGLPLLGELAAALRGSAALTDAVNHDYYQPIAQGKEEGELTMALNYAVVDRTSLNLLYTASWSGEENVRFRTKNLELLSEERFSWSVFYDDNTAPGLIPIRFGQGFIPEQLTVKLTLEAVPDTHSWLTDEALASADFTFDLSIDPQFLIAEEIHPIGQWLELDGNRVWLDRLEIYPTSARLVTRNEEDAPTFFNGLYFYLEDENGKKFDALFENGYGWSESLGDNCTGWYVETPWFGASGQLTLHVTAAAWWDLNASTITLDLTTGTAEGLPEGITYAGMEYDAGFDRTVFKFSTAVPSGSLPRTHPLKYLFQPYWRDPSTGQTLQANCGQSSLYLDQKYEGDSIILFLEYTCWDFDMDAVFPIN